MLDMTASQMTTGALFYPQDEGVHFHFLNHLATVKVSGSVSGSMSVVEFSAPRSFGPPTHRHELEDEFFFVVEGEITAQCGDDEVRAGEGASIFLPHGAPHRFQVVSEMARILTITSRAGSPATFDRMVATLGVRVDSPVQPQPSPIDPADVGRVCAEHDIEVVGPPPAPLD
jgi:mannose-6-phosphate isomerase-like protein (cupin superfamily)